MWTWLLLYTLLSHISLVHASTVQEQGCDQGWFGLDCKYKCHCSSVDDCGGDGGCGAGGACQRGWFGPACQYEDLVQSASKIRTLPNRRSDKSYTYTYTFEDLVQSASKIRTLPNRRSDKSWLTDGDQSTCNQDHKMHTVMVKWKIGYPFTWLRLYLNDTDAAQNISVGFTSSTGVELTCVNARNASMGPGHLDIYCDLESEVNKVILKGEGVRSLCSLYISGGRNVALKQRTWQSTTYTSDILPISYTRSNNAVDGNRSPDFNNQSCSHTFMGNDSAWTVSFTQPRVVNRYVLYNRDKDMFRLKGFKLRGYSASGQVKFAHTDTSGVHGRYVVVDGDGGEMLQTVQIFLPTSQILTLCEVEIFGESACPPGKYGLECEGSCQCPEGESCFVSTGQCPTRCPPGLEGPDCDVAVAAPVCASDRYGTGCAHLCAAHCAGRSCDSVTGMCEHGCQEGFKPPYCDTCEDKRYGDQCQYQCSAYCQVDEITQPAVCHPATGTCLLGCRAGYEGLACLTPTPEMTIATIIALCAAFLSLAIPVMVGIVLWVTVKRASRDEDQQDAHCTHTETQHHEDEDSITFNENPVYDPPKPGLNKTVEIKMAPNPRAMKTFMTGSEYSKLIGE